MRFKLSSEKDPIMPMRPKRPCSHPGCRELTDKGKCEAHQVQQRQQSQSRRDNAHLHLYSTQWKKVRAIVLRGKPLCVECGKLGRLTIATVCDHIIPHKGDMGLFYDYGNLQGLCTHCHAVKTATDDGAFGNSTGKPKVSKACGVDGLPLDPGHHWRT